jgi:hypothetical protein
MRSMVTTLAGPAGRASNAVMADDRVEIDVAQRHERTRRVPRRPRERGIVLWDKSVGSPYTYELFR